MKQASITQRVLDFLRACGEPAPVKLIGARTGLYRGQVYGALQRLWKSGRIRHHAKGIYSAREAR